jgi:hypothetical protein
MPALHDDDRAVHGARSEHRDRRELGGDVPQETIARVRLQGTGGVHDGGKFGITQTDRRHQQTSELDRRLEELTAANPRRRRARYGIGCTALS